MARRKLFWKTCLSVIVGLSILMYGVVEVSDKPLGKHDLTAAAAIAPKAPVLPSTARDLHANASALAELQTSLTWQGEPINPRAIATLIPWLSDVLPGAIAVDIAGTTADTNQFSADMFQDDAGRVTASWIANDVSRFATYRSLGQLDNGIHVLQLWINAGGNGVFPFLVMVDFALDDEIYDGYPRQRLVMTRRGAMVLGVGYSGEIQLGGNTITLIPSPDGEAELSVNVD